MPTEYKFYCLDSDDEVALVPGYFNGKPVLAIFIHDYGNGRDLGPFLINRHALADGMMEMAAQGVYLDLEPTTGKEICEVCAKAQVKCTNDRCYPCHKEYCTDGGGLGDDYYHERLWPKA